MTSSIVNAIHVDNVLHQLTKTSNITHKENQRVTKPLDLVITVRSHYWNCAATCKTACSKLWWTYDTIRVRIWYGIFTCAGKLMRWPA